MSMPSDNQPSGKHRPSEYTAEMAAAICDRIAEGESLARICSDPSMPTRDTVRHWCAEHEEFREHYESAEDFAVFMLGEDTVDLADNFRSTVLEKVLRGRVVKVRVPGEWGRCLLKIKV